MTQTAAAPAPGAPPLDPWLRARLSAMMFLQYAVWAAWLPLFFPFLTEYRGLQPRQTGTLFAIGALGGLLTPFLVAQLADRWVNTERLLAASHLLGAAVVWQLARAESFGALVACCVLYSMIYSPTLALTNALSFHHLPDRDRDFGKIRVWGTVGAIAAGIGVGQWLLHQHTPSAGAAAQVRAAQVAGMGDAFRLSAVLGLALGLVSLTLPATPPRRGGRRLAAGAALREFGRQPLRTLLPVAFLVSCMQQFYLFHTAGFLSRLDHPLTATINTIFGVGGGGLMTIGTMSELVMLGLAPLVARRLPRKTLLAAGVLAYVARFAVFAYLPTPLAVLPALALQGLCFTCVFFVAFMIVDEEVSPGIRVSAQAVFNVVAFGLAVIAGNLAAGAVAQTARGNYAVLFGTAMWVCLVCLVLLLAFYPSKRGAAPAAC